jgi:cyclophilin family peptidyl-prolyl cis-trans isomerase
VGTTKRERQKINRQLRLEQMAREARSKRTKNRALLLGAGLPVIVLLIFFIAWVTNNGGDNASSTTATTTTTSTTSPSDVSVPDTLVAVDVDPATGAPVTVAPETLPPGEPTPCPAADGSSPRVVSFEAAPPTCIDPAKTYTALVATNFGDLTVKLDPEAAPLAANNFVVLARYHYFDNTVCHRAITGFMVQCGDPGTSPGGLGNGDPGYEFANENPASNSDYLRGSLAMANGGQDTNGSQFFITTSDSSPSLETNYSLFGQVTEGLDTTLNTLDALGGDPAANGVPPAAQIVITSVTITES